MAISIKPLVDANGRVTTADHPGVANTHVLLRGITQQHLAPDGKGGRRISSIAYNGEEAYDSGMSVDDAALMAEEGVDPAAFMAAPGRGFLGSVQFTAGTLREQAELRVGYDPIVPSNLFHCQGWGKMTEGKKNRLKRAAMWFQEIPGVSLV